MNDSRCIYDITKEFIRENLTTLDWEDISSRINHLDNEFILEIKDYLDLEIFVLSYPMSDMLIDELYGKSPDHWEYISEYQTLSITMMRKYIDFIDFEYVTMNQVLDEDFIVEFIDELDPESVEIYQILNEKFIEANISNIDMVEASQYQTFSEEFIDKYIDLVDVGIYMANHICSHQFIDKYYDNLDDSDKLILGSIVSVYDIDTEGNKVSSDLTKKYNIPMGDAIRNRSANDIKVMLSENDIFTCKEKYAYGYILTDMNSICRENFSVKLEVGKEYNVAKISIYPHDVAINNGKTSKIFLVEMDYNYVSGLNRPFVYADKFKVIEEIKE